LTWINKANFFQYAAYVLNLARAAHSEVLPAMAGIGTKRTFAAPQHFVRYWTIADYDAAISAAYISADFGETAARRSFCLRLNRRSISLKTGRPAPG
jgi:hypothetical protein